MVENEQFQEDADKVLAGGELLEELVESLLASFLKDKNIISSGGLLVPQVGKKAGEEISFERSVVPIGSCFDRSKVSDATSDFWRTLNPATRQVNLPCTHAQQHLICVITPIAYGFDRPLGYFWSVIDSANVELVAEALESATHFLSLHFHSAIAKNALEYLSLPIWAATATTKETAVQAADLCLHALVCSDVIIWEVDTINQKLKTIAVAGRNGSTLFVDLNVGKGLGGHCSLNNTPILIDDLLDVEEIKRKNLPPPTHPELISRQGWRSAIYIPLDIGGRNAGVLAAFAIRPRAFSQMDCNIALAFAQRLCATYVHIERLRELSDMEQRITIEAPAIEAGIMAMERVHDADNSLTLAQSRLSDIVTRYKHDKHHPVHEAAFAASAHIDSAHKLMKRIVKRAKTKTPKLVRRELKPLLMAAVQEIRLQAQTIGVNVHVSCADKIEIQCDTELFHRVFLNLLNNALFFLETDRKNGDHRIDISVDVGPSISISVKDNG